MRLSERVHKVVSLVAVLLGRTTRGPVKPSLNPSERTAETAAHDAIEAQRKVRERADALGVVVQNFRR